MAAQQQMPDQIDPLQIPPTVQPHAPPLRVTVTSAVETHAAHRREQEQLESTQRQVLQNFRLERSPADLEAEGGGLEMPRQESGWTTRSL